MTRGTPWLVAAGVLCILGSSLGMLSATGYNRAGVPASTFELTERELALPPNDADAADGSALSFTLQWRLEGMAHSDVAPQQSALAPIPWMTGEKAAQLGIGSAADLRRHSQVSAFLVLEFDGPAYARELRRVCQNGESAACRRVRDSESRLYVVDAGADAAKLRDVYPDPHLYAIVKGTVAFQNSAEDGLPAALIAGLDVATIQGIEPLRSARRRPSGEMTWRAMGEGRPFLAVIHFGRRQEPWDASVVIGAHADPPPVAAPAHQDEAGHAVTVD